MDLSVPVAGDVQLRVRHLPGAAGARPFLLVHGLASNARVWDEVAGRLASAGHSVYAVDQRGHGESDEPAGGYDIGTAVDDLAAISAELGLRDVVVAGHSWGGNIALRLTAGNPALVAALALVDGGWIDLTMAVRTWEECAAIAVLLRGPAPAHGIDADGMREYLRASHSGWSTVAIEASLADMRVEADGTLTPRPSRAQFMSIIRSLWLDPPGRDYRAVAVPVLMLPTVPAANEQWVALVRAWVAAAAAAMPRAIVTWYPDGEHYLQAQHPERLARDLLDLAHSLGPPRQGASHAGA
jgi:pimeloyl-ACP methyl ester carboxylesterase